MPRSTLPHKYEICSSSLYNKLAPDTQQEFLNNYQEEIAAAGYPYPEGMQPTRKPGAKRRAAQAAERAKWKQLEGEQHGRRDTPRSRSTSAGVKHEGGTLDGDGSTDCDY